MIERLISTRDVISLSLQSSLSHRVFSPSFSARVHTPSSLCLPFSVRRPTPQVTATHSRSFDQTGCDQRVSMIPIFDLHCFPAALLLLHSFPRNPALTPSLLPFPSLLMLPLFLRQDPNFPDSPSHSLPFADHRRLSARFLLSRWMKLSAAGHQDLLRASIDCRRTNLQPLAILSPFVSRTMFSRS